MHTRVHHGEPHIEGEKCHCCEGRIPEALVRAIRSAKAGKQMTRDEFEQWLAKVR